jgi:hypothetical protein
MPAEAALQQVAAQPDALAMADREEKLLLRKQIVDLIAPTTWTDAGAHRRPIDRHGVETRNVEQHAAVADVIA